ncbi:MAG: pimeloyl-ACP methyl ester carboxylesterase [Oleiphilaceae bacterium]|jgi:pimeloyl-ACP methyl ester carboxylesterase
MEKSVGVFEYSRFLIPYRVYGQHEKVIVCVSGAKQTMSAWRSFISHFSKDYKIIVFDMPGQGRSEILNGSAGVPLLEQVEVLHQLLSHLDVVNCQRRYLIGGSWGSIVAAVYAEHHPEVFHRLILGSFGTKPNSVLSSIIDQVQSYIESGRGAEIAPMMIQKFGQYIPDILKKQIISQFNNMSEQQFQSFYEHSVFVTQIGDLKEHMNLELIKIPTLVVMGQFDTIMDLFDTRKATKLIPHGRFKLIKGVGHFLHWEQPDVLPVYESFFDEDQIEIANLNLA